MSNDRRTKRILAFVALAVILVIAMWVYIISRAEV